MYTGFCLPLKAPLKFHSWSFISVQNLTNSKEFPVLVFVYFYSKTWQDATKYFFKKLNGYCKEFANMTKIEIYHFSNKMALALRDFPSLGCSFRVVILSNLQVKLWKYHKYRYFFSRVDGRVFLRPILKGFYISHFDEG